MLQLKHIKHIVYHYYYINVYASFYLYDYCNVLNNVPMFFPLNIYIPLQFFSISIFL